MREINVLGARRRRTPIVVGLVAVLTALVVPDAAAGVHPAVARGGQAGYYVSPGSVNSVKATFVAPTVTCATGTGVQQLRFGVVAPQVNSTVTEFAQLDATCTNGALSYGATLGAGGNTGVGVVSPGDTVTTTVLVSASLTSATLFDTTSNQRYRVTGGGQTLDETAFIGNRPTTGETAIPTFSSPVHLSKVFVNGARITQFTNLREYQVHGTKVLISASRVNHNAFDLFFLANT